MMNTGINNHRLFAMPPIVLNTVAMTEPASISAMIREYERISPNQPVRVLYSVPKTLVTFPKPLAPREPP